MNRGGSIILTGSFTDIGLAFTDVTLSGTPDVPRQGDIKRVKGTITAGSGTALRFRMYEPVTSRKLFEYDDPDVPEEPIPVDADGAVHFADTPIWFDRGSGTLKIQVASDDAGDTTDGTVEVEVQVYR